MVWAETGFIYNVLIYKEKKMCGKEKVQDASSFHDLVYLISTLFVKLFGFLFAPNFPWFSRWGNSCFLGPERPSGWWFSAHQLLRPSPQSSVKWTGELRKSRPRHSLHRLIIYAKFLSNVGSAQIPAWDYVWLTWYLRSR